MQLITFTSSLDRATTLVSNDDGSLTGLTDVACANMVGPFGGITAATIMKTLLMPPLRHGDPVSQTSIYDTSAPWVMVRRPKWVPITLYFHADTKHLDAQGDRPLLGTALASHFGRGYHDQTAEVWSDSGALLATSHQFV